MSAQIQEITMKIAELQTALLSEAPNFPSLLREIHTTLRGDPECVTLLSDAEVGTIIASLQKFTGNFMTAKATKAPSTRAALKSLSADDL